jgi:hypothetical protein
MALPDSMRAISVISVIVICIVFTILSVPAGRQTLCALPLHSPVTMQHQDRKLHLLLPIDSGAAKSQQLGFCRTLLSLLVHGYDPIIINWDADHSRGVGFLQRLKITGTPYLPFVQVQTTPNAIHMQGVHDYLTNITNQGADDDIVFMMDALDIWLQLSPRTLVERFEDLGTPGVVVGAETGCWPNSQDSVST